MKTFIVLAVLFVIAYADHDHGHFVDHNHHGHGGKYTFYEKSDGHDAHHGTSYANIERHDGKDHEVHFKSHPEYHYGWKINDDKHHVYTNKKEERDGHKVKGSYSLVEPDGKTIRIVDYTADHKEGFNAKVSYKHHH